MKIKTSGYLVLVIALLLASSTPLAYIYANNSNPLELTFLIALVGTVISFGILLAKGTQNQVVEHLKNRRNLFPFAFVGASFTIQTLIFSYTTHYISASLLAVLYRSWPLMLILLAPLLLKERTTKYDLLAVGIGFLGMSLVLLGNTAVSISQVELPFAGLVLVAAFIDAVTGVFQKSYKYEMTSTLFLYNFFALAAVCVIALPFLGTMTSLGLSATDIYAILFLGLIQQVALTFMFTSAMRQVKLSIVANATIIVPFITIVLDFLVLHEPIEASYILIALSVAAGLLIQKFAPRTANYASKDSSKSAPTLYDVTSVFVNTKSEVVNAFIRGNGRALAFYAKPENEQTMNKYISTAIEMSGDNCLIINNKISSSALHPDELEFIKEITGYETEDILILGFGKSDVVEDRLVKLNREVKGFE